jgi:hypothetical protein
MADWKEDHVAFSFVTKESALIVIVLLLNSTCILSSSGLLPGETTQKTEEFSSTAAEAYDLT